MNDDHEIDPKLQAWLDELKPVPTRDPSAAARGRARFLHQAAELRQTVSPRENRRQKRWNGSLFRKEKFAMSFVLSALLMLGMLFGGGATVYAAQDDLPNQPLYPLKLLTEDARLWFNSDPQGEVDLLMQMTQARLQEMSALLEENVVPPDSLVERLDLELQQALQITAGLGDTSMQTTLLHLRAQLEAQEQTMARMQVHASSQAAPLLEQTRSMLQTRLRLVDSGLVDPQGFRETIRSGHSYGSGETGTPEDTSGEPQQFETPAPASIGNGSGLNNGCESCPGATPMNQDSLGGGEGKNGGQGSPGDGHGGQGKP